MQSMWKKLPLVDSIDSQLKEILETTKKTIIALAERKGRIYELERKSHFLRESSKGFYREVGIR